MANINTIVRTSFDTTTNRDLMKGYLRKVHDDTAREAKVLYPTVCNDLTTKDEWERDVRLGGLQWPAEIAEGQNIPLSSPAIDTTKQYNQHQFAGGFRMTFKMDFFNKYNLWAKFAKDLGKVMKEAKDGEVATMFNNFTSTTLTCGTGFDGYAIANSAHKTLAPAGTTYSNYLAASISHAAIESARYYFATLKDDMGYWMGAKPTHLVFEPTLWFQVKQLFGSDLKPFEMSNTVNVLPELGLKLFEYNRLTSTTSWFVIAKNDAYDFNVFTALEPKMIIKDASDDTLDKVALSIQFFTYGWGNPKMLYVGRT